MHVLSGNQTSFLLVTGTDRNALEEAAYFYDRIQEASLPFGGVIANRFHVLPVLGETGPASTEGQDQEGNGSPDSLVSHLHGEKGLPVHVARQLVENFDRYDRLARRDQRILQEFVRRSSKQIPILTIPVFDEDIFDVDGLLKVNTHLFPPSGQAF
jgi:hypothetical protein